MSFYILTKKKTDTLDNSLAFRNLFIIGFYYILPIPFIWIETNAETKYLFIIHLLFLFIRDFRKFKTVSLLSKLYNRKQDIINFSYTLFFLFLYLFYWPDQISRLILLSIIYMIVFTTSIALDTLLKNSNGFKNIICYTLLMVYFLMANELSL